MPALIRGLKPAVHNAQIGEFFQYRDFSITHTGGTHLKDMSSAPNGASADTESAWVGTLSAIFEEQCISATSPLIAPSLISLATQSLYIFRVEFSRRRVIYLFTFFMYFICIFVFFFCFFFIYSPSLSPSPTPFSSFSLSFSLSSLCFLCFFYFAWSVPQDKSVDVQDVSRSVDVQDTSVDVQDELGDANQANPPRLEHLGKWLRPKPSSASKLRMGTKNRLIKEEENT